MFAVSISVSGALCWRLAAFAAEFYQEDRVDNESNTNEIDRSDAIKYARVALDAAYAAQFQSDDYAELVKELRAINTQWRLLDVGKYEELCNEAADALEVVLAERDALVSEIKTICDRESDTVDVGFELKAQNERLRTERDALLARLQAAADRLEKLAGDMRPPNNTTPQLFMLANSMKQNVQPSGGEMSQFADEIQSEMLAEKDDEITRLRADNKELQDALDDARKVISIQEGQIQKLREAMKPFAKLKPVSWSLENDHYFIDTGDLRRARTALECVTDPPR